MNDDIYLHAIYAKEDYFDIINTLAILEKILKSQAILSKRKREKKPQSTGFNGIDYISLCDYSKRNIHHIRKYNAFEGYDCHSLSLMFPKEKLNVITPNLIDVDFDEKYQQIISGYGLSENKRYSDIPDEVQVKDSISLSLMSGITIPIDRFRLPYYQESKNIKYVIEQLNYIILSLDRYHYDVPLYDINTMLPLNNQDIIKQLIRKKR